jgi:hypothetical protein
MSDERPSEVLGSLPRTRPHRRSQKRVAAPVRTVAGDDASPGKADDARKPRAATASRSRRLRQPAQPEGGPSIRGARKPAASGPRKPATPPTGRPGATRRRAATRKPGPPPKPSGPKTRTPATTGAEILGTAVQAAAELAEIGLTVSARAIRTAVSRLPRP